MADPPTPMLFSDVESVDSSDSGSEEAAPTVVVPSTPRRVKKRIFCFTLNNPQDVQVPRSWDRYLVQHLLWRVEQGDSGTVHLQGVVKFRNPILFESARQLCPQAHWEVCRDYHLSIAYCKKAKGRLEGPFEIGEGPVQGKRNDVLALKAALDAGASIREVWEEHFGYMLRYEIGVQKYSNLKTKHRSQVTRALYLWGLSGCGKSAFCRRTYPAGEVNYWKTLETWEEYAGHKVVILNDFYGQDMPYSQLLNILDGNPMMVKRRYAVSVPFVAHLVVFTSQKPPWELYLGVADRSGLRRRLMEDGAIMLCHRTEEAKDAHGPIVRRTNSIWPAMRASLISRTSRESGMPETSVSSDLME